MFKFRKSTRYRDMGLQDFANLIDRDYEIEAGILGRDAKKRKTDYYGKRQKMSVADVASLHENSERSFIAPTFKKHHRKYRRELVGQLRLVAMKKTARITAARAVLKKLGDKMVKDIQDTIKRGVSPPLSPVTRKLRKHAGLAEGPPLLARGQLINSFSHKVKFKK